MFIQHEKELDKSKQIIKSYAKYIADQKIKNEVKNKVFENNIKGNMFSETDEFYKNSSINRLISFSIIN